MRLYNNPWLAVTYFLGAGAKSIKNKMQNAIDKRDERKILESAINNLSMEKEDHKRHYEKLEKREKWAMRCLLTAIVCGILGYITMLFSPLLSIIITIPIIPSVIYGIWYSLYGKY